MPQDKIMKEPLPKILDDMDENIKNAMEAALRAEEAAKRSETAAVVATQAAGEAAEKATTAARAAAAHAEEVAKAAERAAEEAAKKAEAAKEEAIEAERRLGVTEENVGALYDKIFVGFGAFLRVLKMLASISKSRSEGEATWGKQLEDTIEAAEKKLGLS